MKDKSEVLKRCGGGPRGRKENRNAVTRRRGGQEEGTIVFGRKRRLVRDGGEENDPRSRQERWSRPISQKREDKLVARDHALFQKERRTKRWAKRFLSGNIMKTSGGRVSANPSESGRAKACHRRGVLRVKKIEENRPHSVEGESQGI